MNNNIETNKINQACSLMRKCTLMIIKLSSGGIVRLNVTFFSMYVLILLNHKSSDVYPLSYSANFLTPSCSFFCLLHTLQVRKGSSRRPPAVGLASGSTWRHCLTNSYPLLSHLILDLSLFSCTEKFAPIKCMCTLTPTMTKWMSVCLLAYTAKMGHSQYNGGNTNWYYVTALQ